MPSSLLYVPELPRYAHGIAIAVRIVGLPIYFHTGQAIAGL